jgi:AcrR family transcriptional regulator
MNSKTASVEQKIILATIDCIEKYGMSGATNRRITQLAGVNLASINYYFRSKNALIQRCMEVTLQNAFDLTDVSAMPGVSAQDRCIAILMNLVEGGFRFPGLSRAHFSTLQAEGHYYPLLVKHLNRFIHELAGDLQHHGCALETNELKLALIQIVSCVMQLILAPDLFKEHQGMHFRSPESCRAYVSRMVNKLLV